MGAPWKRSELVLLDRLYPIGGTLSVLPHLPTRSKRTIKQTAWKRGLRVRKGQDHGQAT